MSNCVQKLTVRSITPCAENTRDVGDCKSVLVSVGIELILFIAASMGLCFGIVPETVLIIQRCFHYC